MLASPYRTHRATIRQAYYLSAASAHRDIQFDLLAPFVLLEFDPDRE
jgi:hypothetical protein